MNETRCNELIRDFVNNGIPTDSGSKRFPLHLEFQDLIGNSNLNDIHDYYHALDRNDKGNFIWVVCTCLGKDTFLELIRKVVCQSVIIEEEERLFQLFTDKNKDVEDRLDYVVSQENKMQRLEEANKILRAQLENYKREIMQKNNLNDALHSKANKYDKLRELLN